MERAAQPHEQLGRVGGRGGDRVDGDLDHRRDERGGYAVPGHVGHQEAHPAFVDREELVEVPRHRGHGLVHGGHAGPAQVGRGRRQDGQLQAARDGQLVLDPEQAPLAVDHHPQGDVAEAQQEHREADASRAGETRGSRTSGPGWCTAPRSRSVRVPPANTPRCGSTMYRRASLSGRATAVTRVSSPRAASRALAGRNASVSPFTRNVPIPASPINRPAATIASRRQSKPAEAQLAPGQRRRHHQQVRDRDPDPGCGGLEAARHRGHHGRARGELLQAVGGAPDAEPREDADAAPAGGRPPPRRPGARSPRRPSRWRRRRPRRAATRGGRDPRACPTGSPPLCPAGALRPILPSGPRGNGRRRPA